MYNSCLNLIYEKKLLNKNEVIIIEKFSILTLQIDFDKYNHKNYVYGDTELVVIS